MLPSGKSPLSYAVAIPSLQFSLDPSHITGRRDLVPLVSRMGLEMNFSGLMVETHPEPESAWSDAAQQLTPADLITILSQLDLRPAHPTDDRMLSGLREKIDHIDAELLRLLRERMIISEEIGHIKASAHLPIVQPDRYRSLLEDRLAQGRALGLDEASSGSSSARSTRPLYTPSTPTASDHEAPSLCLDLGL